MRLCVSARNNQMKQEFWYVVLQEDGTCAIEQFDSPSQTLRDREQTKTPRQQWGSYSSQQEAIAKRVGLIRAGKCQPQ